MEATHLNNGGGMIDNFIMGIIIVISFGSIEDFFVKLFIICSTAFIAGILSKTGQEIQPILKDVFKKLANKIKCTK